MFVLTIFATTGQADLSSGSATVEVVFDQMILIPEMSPLSACGPVDPPCEFPLSASGSFIVTWDDEDMTTGVANISAFSASGPGFLPGLGNFVLTAIGEGPGATYEGMLTDITSGAGGELISGELTIDTTLSVEFTDPPAGGLTLYTKHTSHFVGTLSGGSNGGNVVSGSGSPRQHGRLCDARSGDRTDGVPGRGEL